MTFSLCMLSCSKEAQLEEELPLSGEDEMLYQHSLLEGSTFRKQTATRIFLDVALQNRVQQTDSEDCSENCGSQMSAEEFKIAQLRLKDNRYENRIRSVFKRIENKDSYPEEWFEPFSCPESLSRNDESPSYCKWTEEQLLSILVNTVSWDIKEITLANASTKELLASSSPLEGATTIRTFEESDYVLHRLAKVNEAAIASGTVVALVVTRLLPNGLEETKELLIEIAG